MASRNFLRAKLPSLAPEAALRVAVVGAAVLAVSALLARPAGPASLGPTAQPRLKIVVENRDSTLLAVDHRGTAFGLLHRAGGTKLYRSRDEGRTWRPLAELPFRIDLISVLSNDTLIASLITDSHITTLFRSADHGRSWKQVFRFKSKYGTLTPHSVTDNGRYVYVASYNRFPDSNNHTNWVWRSADDGRTWSVVRETKNHAHVHFVQANPYTGDVYVGYGDSDTAAAIERSTDNGRTWEVVCPQVFPIVSPSPCRVVDMDFDPSGFAIWGQDQRTGFIMRFDLRDLTLDQLTRIPGASYSTFRLSRSVWLVGVAHEPFPGADPNVYLYASNDGGRTFTRVFRRPSRMANTYEQLRVQYAFPNGDFPIQINTYWTIVARLVSK